MPYSYVSYAPTSASSKIEALRSSTGLKARIFKILRKFQGGLTDEEIIAKLGDADVSPSSVRTRRSELVYDGLVNAANKVRLTRRGREATVWTAIRGV